MTSAASKQKKPGDTAKGHHPIGPWSRRLHRGPIADIDGRSETGRYARHLSADLTAHVGGNPSVLEKLLIDRIVRTSIILSLLDKKFSDGGWTDIDARTYSALVTKQKTIAAQLGMRAAAPPPAPAPPMPTLEELLAAAREERR